MSKIAHQPAKSNRIKSLSVLASLMAISLGSPSRAIAAPNGSLLQFVSTPFVAAEKPDAANLSASMVTANGSPFAVQMNSYQPGSGTYPGVLITTANARSFNNLENLSFRLKGPGTTQITVHYAKHKGGSYGYASISASEGILSTKPGADGYNQVSFDAQQLGLSPDSTIDRIVIAPDSQHPDGTFLVTDIRVNGQAAAKSFSAGTKFYRVVHGSATGPLGLYELAAHAATLTNVSVTNNSGNAQTFYIELNRPDSSDTKRTKVAFMTDVVNDIAASGTTISYVSNGNTLDGSFSLANNATATFSVAHPLHRPTFSAKIWVGNSAYCGNSYTYVGATFAEFTLNVLGPAKANCLTLETADISEVNGVNALYTMTLPQHKSNAYATWWDSSNYLTSGGAYIEVTSIANSPGAAPGFTGDESNVGVYPFGCDTCVSRTTPGCLPITNYPTSPTGCNSAGTGPGVSGTGVCQLGRYYPYHGGTVGITLSQYPFVNP